MRFSVERDTLGGEERWYFEVLEAEADAPAHLALTGYERTLEDGSLAANWDSEEVSEEETAIQRDDIPIPPDLVDEARRRMLDQARLAIRAYVAPVYLPV